MAADEDAGPSWRRRRPGSTGLLLIAFVAVLLLWLQVRPDGPEVRGTPGPPTAASPGTTTTVPLAPSVSAEPAPGPAGATPRPVSPTISPNVAPGGASTP